MWRQGTRQPSGSIPDGMLNLTHLMCLSWGHPLPRAPVCEFSNYQCAFSSAPRSTLNLDRIFFSAWPLRQNVCSSVSQHAPRVKSNVGCWASSLATRRREDGCVSRMRCALWNRVFVNPDPEIPALQTKRLRRLREAE